MNNVIETKKISSSRSVEAKEFVQFPFRLYDGNPHWVPWFNKDMKSYISRKHPSFEHSEGDFFIATLEGVTAGRMAVFHNTRYNEKHGIDAALFYFFDWIDNVDVCEALINNAERWAKDRGLNRLLGPLMGGFTGGGILVDGFDHRTAMTMMLYNYPYYQKHLEGCGFEKKMEFFSSFINPDSFSMPDKIRRATEITLKRGNFSVMLFKNSRELRKIAGQLGEMYNTVLGGQNETSPLSKREIDFITKTMMAVTDPSFVKILTYQGEIAGFLFTFPDLSKAMQRNQGKLGPLNAARLLREKKRADHIIINGAGILPRYQRLGGNALLYTELYKTIQNKKRSIVGADLVQVAETTGLMLSDIQKLGAKIYKVHRVYEKKL